jgi:hypothetical protein
VKRLAIALALLAVGSLALAAIVVGRRHRGARAEVVRVARDAPSAPGAAVSGDDAMLVATIGRIDTHTFHVPRATLQALLAEPAAHGARAEPHVVDGQVDGLELHGVQRHSVLDALGFADGDVVRALGGYGLTSAAQALAVYARVHEAPQISVDLTRAGRPMMLNYLIE